MKKDSIFDDDTPADYPCRKCEEVGIYCDEWDSRYCCTLCYYYDDDPDCELCDPWEI